MSDPTTTRRKFYEPLERTIQSLTNAFDQIPASRKALLKELTDFIATKRTANEPIELIFICTHNSRRSHLAQIWAQAAAAHYGVENVSSYSGGTEATAFNPRAVNAMQDAGFKIKTTSDGVNPVYEVQFAENASRMIVFSKKYDDHSNPKDRFAAIMTCSHADENCPVVLGMQKRISLPYDDPKNFDGTPQESVKYAERVREIGIEILYAFSQVGA
jgi:arsenate reductase